MLQGLIFLFLGGYIFGGGILINRGIRSSPLLLRLCQLASFLLTFRRISA
jgi:hypothetical protein